MRVTNLLCELSAFLEEFGDRDITVVLGEEDDMGEFQLYMYEIASIELDEDDDVLEMTLKEMLDGIN